ncbi:hypothetical protein JCM11641_002073 [Rhodosporidiobolus odoratus]
MWPSTSSTPEQVSQPTAAAAAAAAADGCPVDHTTRSAWLASSSSTTPSPPPPETAKSPHSYPAQDPQAQHLPTEREISTIPRWLPPPSSSASSTPSPPSATAAAPPSACPMHDSSVSSSSAASAPPSEGHGNPPLHPAEAAAAPTGTEPNWVYPSQASFYTALQRKDRNPSARDMSTVVPIHNAVNERVWQQVLEWERQAMGLKEGEACESKLVSFVGKPREVSPRARWKSLIGYTAPFDRHDWLVDRPVPSPSSPPFSSSSEPTSVRIRYVIDFYTGRGASLLLPDAAARGKAGVEGNFMPNLAFFIDCRPALDGWEGVRMRFNRYWGLGGQEEGGKA